MCIGFHDIMTIIVNNSELIAFLIAQKLKQPRTSTVCICMYVYVSIYTDAYLDELRSRFERKL